MATLPPLQYSGHILSHLKIFFRAFITLRFFFDD